MKKLLALLLAMVMCLTLLACGDDQANNPSDNIDKDNDNATGQTEGEALVLYDEEEGYTFINQDRLSEIVEVVTLSIDNWTDYIGLVMYTKETVQKDAFDEIVSTHTETIRTLGAKAEKCYYFYDFTIELKDKDTGELYIFNGEYHFPEDFNLEHYECTRIKGKLCLIDVPEQAIMLNDDGGRYFIVRHSDITYGPPMGGGLAGTNGYAVSGWVDVLLNEFCK